MRAVLYVINMVLDLYIWILIAQAILSWLMAFGVVNRRNTVVATIWQITVALTEPLLKPIRRVIPPFNGLDLSPMVLILGIILLQQIILRYIWPSVI